MTLPRSSGVLLHPTSLPGGRLGDDAYRFVDWLAAAGQRLWQVLPPRPPGRHGPPHSPRARVDGRAMFAAARAELGGLPFVAENLGVITPPVETLRRDLGLPGMVVLQFAFG